MKSIGRILVLICAATFLSATVTAGTVTSNGTGGGTWATTTTWALGVAPVAGDDVVIAAGDIVTLGANASCTNCTVNTGGTLDAVTFTLTVSATFTLQSGATFKQGGTVAGVPGVTRTFDSASSYLYYGGQTSITGNFTFGNLTWNSTSNGTPSGNLQVNGNLSLIGGTALRGSTGSTLRNHTVVGNVIINGTGTGCQLVGSNGTASGTWNIGGNVTVSGSCRLIGNTSSGTTGIGTFNINGNLVVNSSTATIEFGSNATCSGQGIINLKGNLQNDGKIWQNLGIGSLSINFVGTSAQSLTSPGTTGQIAAFSTALLNMTVNNAAGVTLGMSTPVNGTVTLTSGTLSGSAANLTLGSGATISRSGGAFDAAPTFGATTNVTYTAPAPPASIATGFELPSTVNNLTVNNASGVTLSASTVANGTVTLTSGNVSTGANTLTLGSGATLTGEAAGQYVIGNVTTTRTVGTGASTMGGIGMSVDAGADDFGDITVTRVSGSSGAVTIGGKTGINRKWTVASTGAIPAGRNLTLAWVSDDNNAKDLTTAQAWGSTDGGTTWGFLGTQQDISATTPPTIVNAVNSAVAVNSIVTVSDGANPLPVEMSSFAARSKGLAAELRWSTATETDNYGFEIERKSSTAGWAKVGFVAGTGTSASLHNYSYIDHVGQAGTFEYRVKQIDKNGGFKYSSAMQVEVGAVAKVLSLGANYPNPFNPSTNIEFSVPKDGRVVLKVYNVIGQVVATLFDGQAVAGQLMKTTFDASRLPSGIYFSRIEFGGSSLVNRMMLVK